jgi:hypothetical protein
MLLLVFHFNLCCVGYAAQVEEPKNTHTGGKTKQKIGARNNKTAVEVNKKIGFKETGLESVN